MDYLRAEEGAEKQVTSGWPREITPEIEALYQESLARVKASEEYWRTHAIKDRKGNSVCLPESYVQEDPAHNGDRAVVEYINFRYKNAGAEGYFGYWKQDGEITTTSPAGSVSWTHPKNGRITTWLGDTIAEVCWIGSAYGMRGFGGSKQERINFRAHGVDGHLYAGTYYKSSGTYVRMRRIEGRPRRRA